MHQDRMQMIKIFWLVLFLFAILAIFLLLVMIRLELREESSLVSLELRLLDGLLAEGPF